MKNKILTSVTAVTLMVPFGAHAEILSTLVYNESTMFDKCWEYDNGGDETSAITDACMDCFFLGNDGVIHITEFRRKGEIKFNTQDLSCTDYKPSEWLYYDTYEACENDLASIDADACYRCLYGYSNDISSIDGSNNSGYNEYRGIRFEYNPKLDMHLCYIEDESLVACAVGWYGFPWDNDSDTLNGCTKCPGNGTSDESWGHEKDITDCYIPADEPNTDNTGTYKYTSDCHYTK